MQYYLDHSARVEYGGPFDDQGVPLYPYKGSLIHLPVHLMLFGLGMIQNLGETSTEDRLSGIKAVADWLVANQAGDGCWLTPVPMRQFNLLQPWRSAMIQGLAISCLMRAYRLLGDDRYIVAAHRALATFHRNVRHNGVTTYHTEGPFYEEYPCLPSRHVLNGFIYALWGLHDLVRFDEDNEARLLWNNGLETLTSWLPRYDMKYWSLYHLPARPPNPATVKYHVLHVDQMSVMFELTGLSIFDEYSGKWRQYLDHSLNGLRTIPHKLRWHFTYF